MVADIGSLREAPHGQAMAERLLTIIVKVRES